jgi:hypothetical protein
VLLPVSVFNIEVLLGCACTNPCSSLTFARSGNMRGFAGLSMHKVLAEHEVCQKPAERRQAESQNNSEFISSTGNALESKE